MLKRLYWYLFVYDLNDSAVNRAAEVGKSLNKRVLNDLTGLLLLSYILLIFNSLMPRTADALAHTFWKNEHFTSVHKVKGKLHVADELKAVGKQTEKEKALGGQKSFEYAQHLLWTITYSFVIVLLLNLIYPCFIPGSPTSYSLSTCQPPENHYSV